MSKRTQQGDPKKAIAYLRVSTGPQQLGIEAQLAAIQSFCASRGIQLVSVHTDHGISGAAAIDRCPALLEAIEAVKASGAGLFVTAKRDRVARDVVKSAMVEQLVKRAGGSLVSAAGEGDGDDAASQLMRTLVDAFAQYERALISQRTKSALAAKQAKGERTGGLPIGKTTVAGGLLVANAAEVSLLQRCHTMRSQGLKLREIADKLNIEGVTLRDRKFSEVRIHRLLKAA